MHYLIHNTTSGLNLGIVEADTPEAAWAALCRDAGYAEAPAREADVTIDALFQDGGGGGLDLTDVGAELVDQLGLEIDVDAYGNAYPVDPETGDLVDFVDAYDG